MSPLFHIIVMWHQTLTSEHHLQGACWKLDHLIIHFGFYSFIFPLIETSWWGRFTWLPVLSSSLVLTNSAAVSLKEWMLTSHLTLWYNLTFNAVNACWWCPSSSKSELNRHMCLLFLLLVKQRLVTRGYGRRHLVSVWIQSLIHVIDHVSLHLFRFI